MTTTEEAARSSQPAVAKPSRTRKYVMIGVGVVLLATGINHLAQGWKDVTAQSALAQCDDAAVTSALGDIAKQSHVILKSISDVKSLSRTSAVAKCSALVVASDNSTGRMQYWIGFDGKDNSVHVTGTNPN